MSFLRMTNGEMKKSGIPIIIDWQVKNVRKTQMIAEEDPYDTPIVYWKEAKLNFESTARISKTYSLNKDAFIFKIGTLDTRDMDKVSDLYIKFVKESMRETSSEEIA